MTGVMPEFRGAGIGKAVVQAGIKYLLAAGVSAVQLEVTADNESAIAIYNATGFKPTGKITWLELRLSS
jgi:ribosomal protein S18 acetylase RimI-like enzyme